MNVIFKHFIAEKDTINGYVLVIKHSFKHNKNKIIWKYYSNKKKFFDLVTWF